MKKVTLIAALFVGAISFAQSTVIERFPDDTTGLISTKGSDDVGVYCADFFELTSDTPLGDFTFTGFGTGNLPIEVFVEKFNLYIFAHDSGLPLGNPETGVSVLDLGELEIGEFVIDETGGNTVFKVNVTQANGGDQVVLPAGKYWVSAFPSVIGGAADGGRWNWQGSVSSFPEFEPVLIDPEDLFGLGVFNWTNIAALIGEPFQSFAWTLTDEVLSVETNIADLVSVYPNPTTDILNINVPASVELINVSMFDVLGKQVNASHSNGVVNTSALSNGVYMVKIQTSAGDLIQKIVKQ
ncbi:MAG TPA: T9SS type A sorting domain-containing protein [Aequorivita sp.]|nr:T9SS type A sorting domain-containing protein [Aequorivita sp.]